MCLVIVLYLLYLIFSGNFFFFFSQNFFLCHNNHTDNWLDLQIFKFLNCFARLWKIPFCLLNWRCMSLPRLIVNFLNCRNWLSIRFCLLVISSLVSMLRSTSPISSSIVSRCSTTCFVNSFTLSHKLAIVAHWSSCKSWRFPSPASSVITL